MMTFDEFAVRTRAGAAIMADLEDYRCLLAEWNSRMNLVGAASLDDFWSRHAFDSAQLLEHEPDALHWADLGSGAGLPGIVLAIFLKDRPDARIDLIDSRARRCDFLRAVSAQLRLPTRVHNMRVEECRLSPQIVTARAFAPMIRLLEWTEPFFRNGARGLFLKGQSVQDELAEAEKGWELEYDLHTSQSDSRGRIVRVERAKRRN